MVQIPRNLIQSRKKSTKTRAAFNSTQACMGEIEGDSKSKKKQLTGLMKRESKIEQTHTSRQLKE